jgi:SAM-dependent methyltransferase
MEIPIEECEFDPGSAVDPAGRIFRSKGRIFRGIYGPHENVALSVLSAAQMNHWFDAGLIPTWKAGFSLPDFPLVLEHKTIPFMTIRSEWPAEGLKDAALCYLRVASTIAEAGYCLKDAHPWNVLFERTTPYFIDWGSIRPLSELNLDFWYFQFRKYFLMPLCLFSLKQGRLARALLHEHIIGVGNCIIDLPFTYPFPERPYRIWEKRSLLSPSRFFNELADYVSGLSLPPIDGEWVNYEQPRFQTIENPEVIRQKDRIVQRLIVEDPYATVLDIGCNYGLHSEIAASLGKQVVAVDAEEQCINDLFLRTKKAGRDILVLFMDFLWPNGDSGIVNSIPSAHRRLACDTTLSMALVHHLVFKQYVNFDSIAYNISNFTRKKAIVEFVPADDEHVSKWSPERFPWYTLENFIKAMLKYFRSYSVTSSDPPPRKIVIFESRSDSQGRRQSGGRIAPQIRHLAKLWPGH